MRVAGADSRDSVLEEGERGVDVGDEGVAG
jgi:hypothetical protein